MSWAQQIADYNNARVLAGLQQAAEDARARAAADTMRNVMEMPKQTTAAEPSISGLLGGTTIVSPSAPAAPTYFSSTPNPTPNPFTEYEPTDYDRRAESRMEGEDARRYGREEKSGSYRKWEKGFGAEKPKGKKPKAKKRKGKAK